MNTRRVKKFIDDNQLIGPGDKVLVALSGGADSVALLRLLIDLQYQCEAAHCNFKLRGDESDRDEEFVRNLCKELNIPLHVTHFDTRQYASERKISLEMAARELRYEWFEEIRQQCGAAVVAVAHHQDDAVETILLNLIRGTGIRGLRGIQPRNGDIVRPLLDSTRQEVLDYLNSINQEYITDSTNLTDEYKRNKIRLNAIPALQEINPSVKQSILKTARYLNDQTLIYNTVIEEGKKRVLNEKGIDIESLRNEISPKALLFEILNPLGFNSAQLDIIYLALNGQSGKQFISKSGIRVVKDRDTLIIDHDFQADGDYPPFELEMEIMPVDHSVIYSDNKEIAYLDFDKLPTLPLNYREWTEGDTFVPYGLGKRKLVSDYLTDRKFSIIEKEKQWVLVSDVHIVWLIGERIDDRFKIDESTKQMMVVKMIMK